MAEKYEKVYRLTSPVVKPSPIGHYPYHVEAFLIGHEMIRRELERAETAMKAFNPEEHPWKIVAFDEWLNTFLLPTIRIHHSNEDRFMFPFYTSLGVVTPERHTDDHNTLEGRVNKVALISRSLVNSQRNIMPDSAFDSLKVAQLKEEVFSLADHLRDHFAEEEIFWPPIIKRYGAVLFLLTESIQVLESHLGRR